MKFQQNDENIFDVFYLSRYFNSPYIMRLKKTPTVGSQKISDWIPRSSRGMTKPQTVAAQGIEKIQQI